MKRVSLINIAMKIVLGVAVLTLLVGITASGKEKLAREELNAYYQQQEKLLVEEIRGYLNEKGYQNSGVMLTRMDLKDGTREYKITVHHGKIDRLEEGEKQELLLELADFTFPADNCTFTQCFLVRQ